MSWIKNILKQILPARIVSGLNYFRSLVIKKHDAEFGFWEKAFLADNGHFENQHYKDFMLAMAEESSDDFLQDKIVADFGCGPRGSLAWIKQAKEKIGIDVLADRYLAKFGSDMQTHGMRYINSSESSIPLEDNLVDVMFTLNAVDHVDHFAEMCQEIIRVIKPGGLFIGSFNLEEPISPSEPQKLNEEYIKKHLLDFLEVVSYRAALKSPSDNAYAFLFEGNYNYEKGKEGHLWVKARKPRL